MNTPPVINDFAAVIQVSHAPVFLLAGTAAFVNIYATRLARVSDRLNEVADRGEQSKQLRMQSPICDDGRSLSKSRWF